MKSYIYFFGVLSAIFEVAVSVSISASVVDIPVSIGETAEKRYVTDYKCEYDDYSAICFEKCQAKGYYYSYCKKRYQMCTCTNVVDADLQTPTGITCTDVDISILDCVEKFYTELDYGDEDDPFCNITTGMCVRTIVRGPDLIQATNIECKGIPPAPPQTCVDKCEDFGFYYAFCDTKLKKCTCSMKKPDDSLVQIKIYP